MNIFSDKPPPEPRQMRRLMAICEAFLVGSLGALGRAGEAHF